MCIRSVRLGDWRAVHSNMKSKQSEMQAKYDIMFHFKGCKPEENSCMGGPPRQTAQVYAGSTSGMESNKNGTAESWPASMVEHFLSTFSRFTFWGY